jgi:AcrR family transcriptional regulator
VARKRDPAREAARRREIMATCYRLLATNTHHAMTLASVAEEVGGSKGQIAYYFPTKDALIAATMREALRVYGEGLMAAATRHRPLKRRLKELIAYALPSAAELRERLAFVAEVWSFSKSSRETRDAVAAAYAGLHELTRALLQVGVLEGYVSRRHAERSVVPIAALFDGLAVHGAHSTVDVDALRRHAEQTLEVLLGLRAH